MIELHSDGWFHIKGRGDVASIKEKSSDLGLYDPSKQLLNEKVMIDGVEYKVKGVGTFLIARSKQRPYNSSFEILVESGRK